MKKIISLLIKFLFLFLLVWGGWKSYNFYLQNQKNRIAIAPIASKNKKFVALITAYNNLAHVDRLLFSLHQNYDPFEVIYLDLGSTDGSFERAQSLSNTISFMQTPEGSLFDIYQLISNLDDSDVVLFIQGTDSLAHEHVLEKLNKVYTKPSTWMTYGNFLDYPSYRQIPLKCKQPSKNIVFNNSFRSHELSEMNLTTCYAGLFKNIRKEDLVYKGHFLPTNSEYFYLIPLLEMSGKHALFINDILYLKGKSEPDINPEEISYLRKLPKYKRLKSLS